MRQYKHLLIPDRRERTNDGIAEKQRSYCDKSYCENSDLECRNCLFGKYNISDFENWYMAKNGKK